jgi:hypothetical protein
MDYSANQFYFLVLIFLVAMLIVRAVFRDVFADQNWTFPVWKRWLTFFAVIVCWIILTAITIAFVIALIVGGFWLWGRAFA